MRKRNNINRITAMIICFILLLNCFCLDAYAITTTTYANVVVFIDFKDTTHNHTNTYWGTCYNEDPSDTLQFFNGSNSDDRGLKTYLEKISYGQISVNNIMPQYDGTKITALTLSQNTEYYTKDAKLGVDGSLVMAEVIAYLKTVNFSSYNLDGNSDGVLDNVTVVVPYEYGDKYTSITSHNTRWAGNDKISGKQVGTYNIISEQGLYFGLQDSSLLIHEFLHAISAPDLYCNTGSTPEPIPVGQWDIMATNSQYVQYPLAYIRSESLGIFDIPETKTNGTYSLYSATSATNATKDKQAIILKTDYSDNEFFVVEYRQKNTGTYDYDKKIYGSGLVIYRVDESVVTNINGSPYHIYVFREDDDIYKSFFSSESGRTSFSGLTYSDGTNSGITISNIGSAAGAQISFDVTFGPMSADYWKTESEKTGLSDVGYYVDDSGNQYFASTSANAISIYSYDKGNWSLVSSKSVSVNFTTPKVVKYGNDFYVSVLKDYSYLYLYKYDSDNNIWTDIGYWQSDGTNYAMNTYGAKVYLGTVEADYSDFYHPNAKLTIFEYDIEKNETTQLGPVIDGCKSAAQQSIVEVNGVLIVAFRDGFDNNKIYFKKYNSGSNTWESIDNLTSNSSNFSIKSLGNTLYYLSLNSSNSTLYSCDLTKDNSWNKVGSNNICNDALYIADFAFYNNNPIVIYQDATNEEVYIKYLRNSEWIQLGSRLLVAKTNSLYFSYLDDKIVAPIYDSVASKVIVKVHEFVDATYKEHVHKYVDGLCTICGEAKFAGGDGTAANPYLVSDKQQLNNVRENLSANYMLTNDIVFNDADFEMGGLFYNAGKGWEPIGNNTDKFTGTFDGNGHTIKNLKTNATTYYIGLFGYSSGGSISNLGLLDCNIYSSGYYVGGICGYAEDLSINNCYNTGAVRGARYIGGICGKAASSSILTNCYNTGSENGNYFVGGICGQMDGSTITSCNNIGTVKSAEYAGGICGQATNSSTINKCYNIGIITDGSPAGGICGSLSSSTITSCYNAESVTGSYFAGGISGQAYSSTINNCYNTGNVSSSGKVGGICGYNSGSSVTTNCYNIGSVSGGDYLGGICGYFKDSPTITNCYYLNSIGVGIGNIGAGTDTCKSCTCDELKKKTTFVDFDFTSVWEMGDGENYDLPVLKGVKNVTKVRYVSVDTLPTKLSYKCGESLDLTGGKILVVFDSCNSTSIPMKSDMVSGYDEKTVGDQTLSVTYEGCTSTFDITVIQPIEIKLADVSITSPINCVTAPTITVTCNSKSLTMGTDYTVTYGEINGTCQKVTITGIGNYYGTVISEYTINHNYGSWEKCNNAQHKKVCASDSNHVIYENHDIKDVVTPATSTSKGYTTHTCSKCGYSYVDSYKDYIPSKIELNSGSGYVKDGSYIKKVAHDTTISSFGSKLKNTSRLKFFNSNGVQVTDGLICTGYYVGLFDGSKMVDKAYVVVTGDVNGDGKITALDYIAIKNHIMGSKITDPCKQYGADYNGDGVIRATDYVGIKNLIMSR